MQGNALHYKHHQLIAKGQTMQRNIFTNATRTDWCDVAAAIAIGLALAVGALAYFDVLFF